jgi:hypothetical protein
MRISYAKFLQLLRNNRIKRLIIYGDLRTAIVEVPHPWTANIAGAPGQYGQYTGRVAGAVHRGRQYTIGASRGFMEGRATAVRAVHS